MTRSNQQRTDRANDPNEGAITRTRARGGARASWSSHWCCPSRSSSSSVVADMARVYTTMITIESAAREAADYGSYGSANWDSDSSAARPLPAMEERACMASRHLTDYVGDHHHVHQPAIRRSRSTEADGNRRRPAAAIRTAAPGRAGSGSTSTTPSTCSYPSASTWPASASGYPRASPSAHEHLRQLRFPGDTVMTTILPLQAWPEAPLARARPWSSSRSSRRCCSCSSSGPSRRDASSSSTSCSTTPRARAPATPSSTARISACPSGPPPAGTVNACDPTGDNVKERVREAALDLVGMGELFVYEPVWTTRRHAWQPEPGRCEHRHQRAWRVRDGLPGLHLSTHHRRGGGHRRPARHHHQRGVDPCRQLLIRCADRPWPSSP